MILGVDLGNYSIKTSTNYSFNSLVSRDTGFGNTSNTIEINNESFILGIGNYDNEYRKINKKNLDKFLFGAIAMSSDVNKVKVVSGLPISQFKKDKNIFKEKVLSLGERDINFKGISRRISIEDFEVFPEGLAAINNSKNFDGVIMDLGGRTTDIFRVSTYDNKITIQNGFSEALGTLNLYSDFIKILNMEYGLNLNANEAERIIKNGLRLHGKQVDISKHLGVFKDYVEMIIDKLKVEFPIATLDIKAIGGGAALLGENIKKRVKHVELLPAKESVFLNANYFKKQGIKKWGEY